VSFSPLSRRGRRISRLAAAPSAVCVALILACAVPAAADASCTGTSPGSSGVVCGFTLSPSSFTAGGDPNISSSVSFDYGTSTTNTAKNVSLTLPPGLFASLGAITQTCTTAELTAQVPECPPASQVGSGTLDSSVVLGSGPGVTAPTMQVKLFLMPAPTPADAAGIGATVSFDNLPITTTTGVVDEQEVNGNPVLLLSLPSLPQHVTELGIAVGIQIKSLSFTINGTATSAAGAPTSTAFTRLPTSCATATSMLSVQTWAATSPDGASSSSFTPTNCSALAFTPSMSGSATRDAKDPGVTLTTTVTTNPTQAATKTLALTVPTGTLAPDVFNAGHLFGKVIGSATAVTPLVTTPLVGTVTLTGTIASPALTITFPPPFSLVFSGAVNIIANSVTFSSVPDVPLNSLTLKLEGGPTALFYSTCAQPNGTLHASFGGQNGATAPVTAPLKLSGCPKPVVATVSSVSSKFKGGSARLSFGLAAGDNSPGLSSFTVSLPKGLSFNPATYKQGVKVAGATIKSVSLSHGKLVVKLKSAVPQVSVQLSGSALTESATLKAKIEAKKVKSLSATVTAKNASGKTTRLKLKLSV
jgi:hypothetical protein